MNDIKNFQIGKAFYIIENSQGSKLKINVDYKDDSFEYKVINKGGDLERLKEQARIIAKDMLSRKAKKNLNYKLVQLKM